MRLHSILAFSTALLTVVSALAIPARPDNVKSSLINLDTTIERAAPPEFVYNLERRSLPAQKAKVTFAATARKQLDDLNLHGKARKRVKQEHKNRVKMEMKKNGATKSEIQYLAHSTGSVDPNIHITATFTKERKTKKGPIITVPLKSKWTSSDGKDHSTPKHHFYVNMSDKTKGMDAITSHFRTYKAAVQAKQGVGHADPKI